ncbi:MAG TPA: CocE/NonD family hydrolase [Candidatus Obscuribacterales bacterium]
MFLLVLLYVLGLPANCQPARAIYTADITTRSGIKLAADIYLPKGDGKYPAILLRTPYDPRFKPTLDFALKLAGDAYAVVVAHCRGRYDSDGKFVPFLFENEAHDGYDTVDWIAKQPWCNGKIGTMGASYLGMVQWQLAALKNPHVRCMFIVVAPSDLYRDMVYPGGAFALQGQLGWHFLVSRRTDQVSTLIDWHQALNHLPITSMNERIGTRLPVLREYMEQSRYGRYWQGLYCLDRLYKQVATPTFLVGGFNDGLVSGTLEAFAKLRQQLSGRAGSEGVSVQGLVGPWDHLGSITGLTTRFGDIDYGPAAQVDVNELAHRWFDHWLKDKPLTDWQKAPLRYFLAGYDAWQETATWPPPSASEKLLYLHSNGRANRKDGDGTLDGSQPGSEPADSFTYDPAKPVPSAMSRHILFGSGPKNLQEIEQRDDVLVYSGQQLPADLIVAGNPRVVLHAGSDAPDTDFCAWVCDVSPDGRSIAVQDGIVRASRYLSGDRDSVLSPGSRYRFEIALGPIAHVFKEGHRIRLVIASSNFPAFDRNLNTGRKNWLESEPRIAHQTVFHAKESPSCLILPVLPEKAPGAPKQEISSR